MLMQSQAPDTKGLLLWDSYSNELNVYGCTRVTLLCVQLIQHYFHFRKVVQILAFILHLEFTNGSPNSKQLSC